MKVLIVPVMQGKPWTGSTIYTEGLGGSESAVVYMARAMSRHGAQVTVLSHGTPGTYEGVAYRHGSEFGAVLNESWDVVVVSRWTDALRYDWKTHHLAFWIHDLPFGDLQLRCHEVITISEFQTSVWHLAPEVTFRSRNGFDPAAFFFDPRTPRDTNRLLWVSNPDRGLPIAARIFQDCRKRWPSLELHVYGRAAVYGWDSKTERPFLPRKEDMENIFLHEPLNRQQLGVQMRKSWALFYPTYWHETSCMTAIEAQACGLPIISSPIGALPETVRGGILTNDFLNAVSQLRNVNRWQKLSAEGRDHVTGNYEWSRIASEWLGHFYDCLSQRGVPGFGDFHGSRSLRAEDKLPEMVGEAGAG